jgi:hypothetical protein
MILETIDFKPFFKHIEGVFNPHFSAKETRHIMKFVSILADANFRCYKANMIVIKERKKTTVRNDIIADMEWVARSVGEYRVASKANINRYISNIKTIKEAVPPINWMSDDIVYSVGEMMDRLSIETIKREDFRVNNRPKRMTQATQKLSDRVEKYLRAKLVEIDAKGFYECVHEQRTYDLKGITQELAL